MKNYQIKGEDGQMYWVHRNIAVASFIFKLDLLEKGAKFSILANKRGSGTPDNQGKWNCPCGYLDFDETLAEAAAREVYEECGLKIDPNELEMFAVNDKPDSHMQNVTCRFMAVLNSAYNDVTIDKGEGGEEDEVDDIQWIPVEDIDNYEWAYNHKEIIKKLMS